MNDSANPEGYTLGPKKKKQAPWHPGAGVTPGLGTRPLSPAEHSGADQLALG